MLLNLMHASAGTRRQTTIFVEDGLQIQRLHDSFTAIRQFHAIRKNYSGARDTGQLTKRFTDPEKMLCIGPATAGWQ